MIFKRWISTCFVRNSSWWNHPGHKDFKSKLLEQDFSIFTDGDYYTDHSIYPEIKLKYPTSNENWGKMNSEIAWYFENIGRDFDKIKTVEEKLAILAHHNCYVDLDRYGKMKVCRHHVWQLQGCIKSARSLPLVKYLTNTHDASWEDINFANGQFVSEDFISAIENTVTSSNLNDFPLACEYGVTDSEKYKAPSLEQEEHLLQRECKNREILCNLTRTIFVNLPLGSVSYNNDAQIAAYWKRGGFSGVEQIIRGEKSEEGDDIRSFQFVDVAVSQLKRKFPLKPLSDISHGLEKYGRVPYYLYHPSLFNIFTDQTLPMQIPGQWYGSKHPFNLLTFYSTAQLANLEWLSASPGLERDSIVNWAILAGHAELTAQAYHLGFSLWKRDITYPMTAQLVLMDGDQWTFAIYQLNSLQIFKDQYSKVMPNICWISPTYKWNRDTALILAQMASMPFSQDDNLSPYLIHKHSLSNERHRQLARQLYDCVQHCRPQSRFDTTKVKSTNAGTNFFKWYDDICSRFQEVVREKYPKQWWGHSLQRIDRIRSHPTEFNYDKLRPNEKTTFIYEY